MQANNSDQDCLWLVIFNYEDEGLYDSYEEAVAHVVEAHVSGFCTVDTSEEERFLENARQLADGFPDNVDYEFLLNSVDYRWKLFSIRNQLDSGALERLRQSIKEGENRLQ